jgi:hypothetical protein
VHNVSCLPAPFPPLGHPHTPLATLTPPCLPGVPGLPDVSCSLVRCCSSAAAPTQGRHGSMGALDFHVCSGVCGISAYRVPCCSAALHDTRLTAPCLSCTVSVWKKRRGYLRAVVVQQQNRASDSLVAVRNRQPVRMKPPSYGAATAEQE